MRLAGRQIMRGNSGGRTLFILPRIPKPRGQDGRDQQCDEKFGALRLQTCVPASWPLFKERAHLSRGSARDRRPGLGGPHASDRKAPQSLAVFMCLGRVDV